MYMDETGHISNFVVKLIVILQWGNKGGEGEGEVEIIHMCIYMYTRVTTCLNEIKKEARQVNQKFFEF